jgi:hypothetical protein
VLDSSCDFEGELTRRAGPGATDFGTVPIRSDIAVMQTARQRVLDALAAKQPFKLRIQRMGTDSLLFDAYASDGTRASVLQRDLALDPSERDEDLYAQLCDTLAVDTNCMMQSGGSLCLLCKGSIESSKECAPQLPNGECNRAGSVDTHVYRPCCEGLRALFPLLPRDDLDGKTMCVPSQQMAMACIEGRCGDGRCESGERQPCGGCTADCQ